MAAQSKNLDSVIVGTAPEQTVIRKRNQVKTKTFALRYAQRAKIVK